MSLSKPKLTVGGLMIGPNDLDNDPGNFLVADNCVHRRAGILEPLPGENFYMESTGWQYSRVFSDWEPNTILKLRKQTADSFAKLMDPSDIFNTTAYDAQFQPGETQCVFTDGRHILSGADRTVVVDSDNGVPSAPRPAGLPSVLLTISSITDVTGTGLVPSVLAHKYVMYQAIVRRKLPGGRYIQSAPSTPVWPFGHLFDVNVVLTFAFDPALNYFQAGDEVLVYRTAAADSVAEVNGSFYFAAQTTIDATILAGGGGYVQDNTLEINLGEELYTNPGQQGALKANLVLPVCSGVETYANTTFYINKQAQPLMTLSGPLIFGGGIPPNAAVGDVYKRRRTYSAGQRTFAANTTASSTTITVPHDLYIPGMAVGQKVEGAGIPADTYIVSINPISPASSVVLSNAATATASNVTLTCCDVMIVKASKNGVVTTSLPFKLSSVFDAAQNIINLQDAGLTRMYGFSLLASSADQTGNIDSDNVNVSLSVQVLVPGYWDSFQVLVTNPIAWTQGTTDVSGTYRQIDSVQETRRNVVWYGKTNLPEDVSPVQFITIGNGTVYRLLNVQSVMLAFCSDGLYKVFGQGDTWSTLPVDLSARLIHPDCAVASGQLGFAWLEQGLCAVSENGAEDVGKDAIGPTLKNYAFSLAALSGGPRGIWGPSLVLDRYNNEVWLNIVYMAAGQPTQKYETFIFNTQTGKFTTAANTYTALSYYPSFLTLIRAKHGTSGDGLYRPYFPPESLSADYLPATVVYQPLVSNAGLVKQWVDANLFLDQVPALGSGTYRVEALFGGETSSSTNVFDVPATAPSRLFALHSLVPRRVARDVKLTLGFATSITPDSAHPSGGYYFQFKGASVRVRVASDIVKR